MDIAGEISRIRDLTIPKERVQRRAEYEDKARKALLSNLTSLSWDSFESIVSLMNTDFWAEELHNDRFSPLFSPPQMNKIKTNNIEQLKTLLAVTFEKEDLTKVDEVTSKLYGISYGAASLCFYVKDSKRYNVFLPSTVRGLKAIYPEKAANLFYGKPFERNYSLFNDICNSLKRDFSVEPQELDIILTILGQRGEGFGEEQKESEHSNLDETLLDQAWNNLTKFSNEIGFSAAPFLTFLIDKKYGVPATPTQVTEFFKEYNLYDNKRNVYFNPWMRKPYRNEGISMRTVDHFHQPREFGCWNDRDTKVNCDNTACKYYPTNKKVSIPCNFQKEVIWKRKDPTSVYSWGENYINVLKNNVIKNKVPLRDLLTVFYRTDPSVNTKTYEKFANEFKLNNNEIGELFELEGPLIEMSGNEVVSYFILRTGGGGYDDNPEESYHFREGIPGSLQLKSAENRGKFVYL